MSNIELSILALLCLIAVFTAALLYRTISGVGKTASADVSGLKELGDELQRTREELKSVQQRSEQKAIDDAGTISHWKVVAEQANMRLEEAKATLGSFEATKSELAELQVRNAGLIQDNANKEKRLEEQREWIEERIATFESRIKALTSEMLEKQMETVDKKSRKSIDDVISPFSKSLNDFRSQVETFAKEQASERDSLKERVKVLAEVHGNLSEKTDALTKALTTQNKQQGDWGETQLIRLLEGAGFQEGIGYRKQVTVLAAGEEKSIQRPDVIIELPEDRQVVVDSKVSLTAWTDAHATDDEDERNRLLANHLTSIRKHVDDLSRKDYASSPDIQTLDMVIMFMYVEPAHLAAMSMDPGLFQHAYNKGVIIAGPTMLLAILKLINSIWDTHKQEENAAHVLDLAGKIHTKLISFVENFEAVGTRMESAASAFTTARNQLIDGKGNAMKMLDQMDTLGVSTKKKLPQSVVRDLKKAPQLEQAE